MTFPAPRACSLVTGWTKIGYRASVSALLAVGIPDKNPTSAFQPFLSLSWGEVHVSDGEDKIELVHRPRRVNITHVCYGFEKGQIKVSDARIEWGAEVK